MPLVAMLDPVLAVAKDGPGAVSGNVKVFPEDVPGAGEAVV